LVVTRDLLTFGAVLAVAAVAFAALYWGPAWLQNWVGYTEAWLLLTSEIKGLAIIVVNRVRGGRALSDDAERMAE
jgi:hypothetical protein